MHNVSVRDPKCSPQSGRKEAPPFVLPSLPSQVSMGSILLTLPPSPPSLVLQAFKALPFGSSEASAVLCQVSNNTDVEYK